MGSGVDLHPVGNEPTTHVRLSYVLNSYLLYSPVERSNGVLGGTAAANDFSAFWA